MKCWRREKKWGGVETKDMSEERKGEMAEQWEELGAGCGS